MPMIVHIPAPLRPYAHGLARVELAGTPATLGQALDALWRAHPALRDRVLNDQGEVRQHVHLFVGNDDARRKGGLLMPAPPDCEITILPAVSGGATNEP